MNKYRVKNSQDMLTSYMRSIDVHRLRNDPGKHFFDLKNVEGGASSAQGVEQNYVFVLQLVSTMAGAPMLPNHGKFKADKLPKKTLFHVIFLSHCIVLSLMFRQSSTRWPSPMDFSIREPGREPSRISIIFTKKSNSGKSDLWL